MPQSPYRQKLGQIGEKIACNFLLKHGLILLQKNYLIRAGQIDLVFQSADRQKIHFIEVKSRFQSYSTSDLFLSRKQQHSLQRTAEIFLQQSNLQLLPWQFDLVWINFSYPNSSQLTSYQLKAKINYLPNAFIS